MLVKRHSGLLFVLLAFLAINAALNVTNPLWEALDEPEHFQYVKFIAQNHALPPPGIALPSISLDGMGETFQPPLYYAIESLFVLPINLNTYVSLVRNPYFTWPNYPLRNGVAIHTLTEQWPYRGMVLGAHVMRAVSGLMAAGTIVAIYLIALAVFESPRSATLCALAAAITPSFLMSSATITNDVGAALMASLALLAATRVLQVGAQAWRWFALYGLLSGLAVLTKANAFVLAPVGLLLAIIVLLRSRPLGRGRAARAAALNLASLLAAFSATVLWYYLQPRNSASGYVEGYASSLHTVWQTLSWARIRGIAINVFETHWGSFGWETFHLPQPVYLGFVSLALASAGGWALAAQRSHKRGQWKAVIYDSRATMLVVLAFTLVTLLGSVAYWNLVTADRGATAHARFLFPGLAGTAILIVGGLLALPRGPRIAGFVGLFGMSFSVVAYALFVAPSSFGPTVPVYGDQISAGVQHRNPVRFSNSMELLGWSGSVSALRPGGNLRIVLYWGSLVRPDFDYSAFLRLNNQRGTIIHDSDHGPGSSLNLLPHNWEPGEVIPDAWQLHIPSQVAPGAYSLEVGLYDYRNMRPIPTVDNRPTVRLSTGRIVIQGSAVPPASETTN